MGLILAGLLALLVTPQRDAPAAAPVPAAPSPSKSAPATVLSATASVLLSLVPDDALAVVFVPDLPATIDRAGASQIWERLMAGELGGELKGSRPWQKLRVVRGALLGATGLDWQDALAALGGGGLVGVLLPNPQADGEPLPLLLAAMTDVAACERGLAALMAFLPGRSRSPTGSSWRLSLGEGVLERRDNLLLLADSRETLDRVPRAHDSVSDQASDSANDPVRDETSDSSAVAGLRAALVHAPGRDALLWASAALLSAEGEWPRRLDDPGVSLLVGQWQAVLREASWVAAGLAVAEESLRIEFTAPADGAALARSHGPFFPDAGAVALPRLSHSLGTLIAQRDLGGWWNARDEFLSERGLAESVEPDGNLSLLFQRDLGADVLAWLEPELLIVSARCKFEQGAPEPEYPAAALGLVPAAGHPDDYRAAFVSAFFAVVSFTNFDKGGAGRPLLEPDIEELADGARLYRARWRSWTGVGAPPERYNFTPSLLLAADGRLWLSTSATLLRRIARAPTTERQVRGWSLSVDLREVARLLLANHDLLLARRLLQSGGDFADAERQLKVLQGAAELFDEFTVDARLQGDVYTLQLSLELH